MHRAFFIILLLRLLIGSDADCSDCTDGFTCIWKNDTVTACTKTCEESEVFRLNGDTTSAYVYKGDDVTLGVNLEGFNLSSTYVTVKVTFDGRTEIATKGNSGTYFFNVKNVTKKSEGDYIFSALGNQDANDLCSATAVSIAYVFTIEVRLQRERYVLTKGVTKIIPVWISSKVGDWSRIRLHEISPFTDKHTLRLPDTTVGDEFEYQYQITTPQKHDTEGVYQFIATEHATNASKTTSKTAVMAIYVHSTLLEAEVTSYSARFGDDVAMGLVISTDLMDWKNVTVNVALPNGTTTPVKFDETAPTSGTSLEFAINGIGLDDFGVYTFAAIENGNSSYAMNITVYGEIAISSDLPQKNDSYIALRGQNSTVRCSVDVNSQNVSWWAENGEITTNDTLGEIYQDGTPGNRTLHVKSSADYNSSGNFTCKTAGLEKIVSVAIEGISDSAISYKNGTFACVVRGNPLPSVAWNVGDDAPHEPFFNESTHGALDAYTMQSKVNVLQSTLCLGDQTIACNASNDRGTNRAERQINTGFVGIYQDQYATLSQEKVNNSDAIDICVLITVKDKLKEKFVTDLAEKHGVEDFYIGAQLDGGAWKWPDGSDVSYLQLPTDGEICAKYSNSTSGWEAEAVNCSELLAYACEFKENEEYVPTELFLSTVECDGRILNVSWSAPDGINQNITIRTTTGEATTENLPANTDKKEYENVLPETEYIVKVDAQREYCTLYPYVEASATTGLGPPEAPESAEMRKAGDTECKLTWAYDDNDKKLERFWLEVTANVTVDPKSTFSPTVSTYQASSEDRKFNFTTLPNTQYGVKIFAESCSGNGSSITPSGSCLTPIAAPTKVDKPDWLSGESGAFKITIPAADNRDGPISCQFLVVRYVGPNDVKQGQITENQFANIKQSDSEAVNVGEEYFAYATTALSAAINITLGDETQTSFCVPLSQARRKREISQGQNYTARNREIKLGIEFIYYMITTTPNENGSKAYVANSEFSKKHIVEERPSSHSPNASVIVLSILAALIVIVIIIFLYRRWTYNSKKRSRRSFRFSYKADSSYDAL